MGEQQAGWASADNGNLRAYGGAGALGLTYQQRPWLYAPFGRIGGAFVLSCGETMSSMGEYRDYMARAAKCEQKAKDVESEDEKQSRLALADSWRQTADLQRSLNPQLPLIQKAMA